jgi:hypothetical protein
MAGAGFKTFVSGAVLGATEVNTFLMQQSVMTFTNTTARNAAITSPSAGMLTFIVGTKTLELYDGAGWTGIGGGDYATFPNQATITSGGVTRIQPFAIEQGSQSVTGSQAISFTTGRFTVAPQVFVTVQSSTNGVTSATVGTPTTSGFTAYAWTGSTAATLARTVSWIAIQMKSGGANG